MANSHQSERRSNTDLRAALSSTSDLDLHAPTNFNSATATLLSEISRLTVSTGVQSQTGARWAEDYVKTINSGFAAGTPRSANRKGVREGRETGVAGMPAVHGVGRTGKAPAPVPAAMVNAIREQNKQKDIVKEVEITRSDGQTSGPPVSRNETTPSERPDHMAPEDVWPDTKKRKKRARSQSPMNDRQAAPAQERSQPSDTRSESVPEASKAENMSAASGAPMTRETYLGQIMSSTERRESGSYAFVPRERMNPFQLGDSQKISGRGSGSYAFSPRERMNPFQFGDSEKISEADKPATSSLCDVQPTERGSSFHSNVAPCTPRSRSNGSCHSRGLMQAESRGKKRKARGYPDGGRREQPEEASIQVSKLEFPASGDYFNSPHLKKLSLPYLEEEYMIALKDHAYLLVRLRSIPADDDGRYWERRGHYSADVFRSEGQLEDLADRLVLQRLECEGTVDNLEERRRRERKVMCESQGEKLEKLAGEVWLEPMDDLNPVHYGSVLE